MIGGARRPELAEKDDDAQIDIALTELREIMGVESKPDFIKVFRHKWAIPQYNVGHAERVEKIEKRLTELPGIFVAGNSYKGIGFNDCVISANQAVAGIREYLKKPG